MKWMTQARFNVDWMIFKVQDEVKKFGKLCACMRVKEMKRDWPKWILWIDLWTHVSTYQGHVLAHTEANSKEFKKLFYVSTYPLHVSTNTERILTNSKFWFYVPTYTSYVSTHNV